jgi:tetratricopeptide (TPR) repeat protein
MRIPVVVAVAAVMLAPLSAQTSPERQRAGVQVRLGMESMHAEQWAEAARLFQRAIDIDNTFESAYYWLGRADMALKKYPDAIAAYTKCRSLYEAMTGKRFSSAQEAQRFRNDRITEIDEMIRQVQTGPQTVQAQDQLRQLQDRRRQVQELIQRGTTISIENAIPAWVSLALGSAYFRAERFADAEREYKAALEADQKAGEAHNNLAVVYLLTGRPAEAEKAVAAAKKTGFRVNPQLEQDIKNARRGS